MRYEPSYSKMSTENVHGAPTIRRENGHIETGFNNQSQTVLEPRGPQNEDGSQCTGLSQADGSGDISDQAAAETLVHFRDQISHEANRNGVTTNGDTIRQHEQSMPYGSTGFWQPRPGNSNGVNQQQTVQYTQDSGNLVQNDNVSMDMNLQNVIVSISRTLSSIQQKQDCIQQKQDSMQQKQELFESAFQSVVAVLQEMRSVPLTNNQREASSVPARPALPNELPQNPQREVVSDGSNVRQPCQRNSSISYVQENVSATLVPRANSSHNSTQDSGQSSTASYRTYEVEHYEERPANTNTDDTSCRWNAVPTYKQNSREESIGSMGYHRNDPMHIRSSTGVRESEDQTTYREAMTVSDARDHTYMYNMRAQGGESSRHQSHAWKTPRVIEDRPNTTTDRTVHRNNIVPATYGNRVEDTIYQRNRMYSHEYEMPTEQNTEISRGYEGEMFDTTDNRGNGRQVYQPDNRMGQELNSYQYNDRGFAQRNYSQMPENSKHSYNYGIKFPSFDGKEDWKVWISRFEEIAERRNWDNDMKLDNLLPKLQGRAGDFVFTQLPKDTLKCYPKLVKELNSRFRVVETKRTFASKFSQRVQKPNETVEEYAADLKRLYSKAYQQRDAKTRQEDLVRKFLDGLKDNDARFEIEYNKEPEDIDQAVYHAVNFIQTRRRNQETFADKYKKFVRRATEEISYDTDEEYSSENEELEHVYRVPQKSERPASKKPKNEEVKSEKVASESDIQHKLLTETRDLMQTLVSQIAAIANDRLGKQTTSLRNNQPRRGVVCFKCNEQGHVIRDCPRNVTVKTEEMNTGSNSLKANDENPNGSLN